MSYLEFAYPNKNFFNPTKKDDLLIPTTTKSEIGGLHYYTWRNIIAREAMADKEDFNVDANPERIPGVVADRYQDHNFIQTFQPLQLFRPATLAGGTKKITKKDGSKGSYLDPVVGGLKGLINNAQGKGLKVKAVGTGHSFSDIMTTPDFLVVTDDLNEMLKLENASADEIKKAKANRANIRHYPFLNAKIKKDGYISFLENLGEEDKKFYGKPTDHPALVEFEAGIKIRDLNDQLWDLDWSLYNMGTYQGQSFIGAASTSTHGSGNDLGPLPDMIRSIVIVADEGVSFRIEPTNGISAKGSPGKPNFFPVELIEKAGLKDCIFKTNEKDVDFLIQNDDCFNAAIVNVGTFGIVYSVIIEVIPKIYLLETNELTTWTDLRKRLIASDPEIFEAKAYTAKFPIQQGFLHSLIFDAPDTRESHDFSNIRQVSILFNPNKYKGENFCRITRQYIVEADVAEKWVKKNDKGRGLAEPFRSVAKNAIDDLGETLGFTENAQKKKYAEKQNSVLRVIFQPVSGDPIATVAVNVDSIAGKIIKDGAIQPSSDDYYMNRAYRVYVKPSDLPGYGTETGFSMEKEFKLQFHGKIAGDPQKAYIIAVDHAIEMAAQHWEEGRYVQTANSAIRFIKGSRAFLSPQFGELTCMIEMLNVADTHGGKELFYRYQREFFKYGGRPHWGLDLSVTTGNNNLMQKMYPKFPEWKKIYDLMNFHGTFNNRFTDRMGLSVQNFPGK